MADRGRNGLQQARSVSKVYVAERNVAALQFAPFMNINWVGTDWAYEYSRSKLQVHTPQQYKTAYYDFMFSLFSNGEELHQAVKNVPSTHYSLQPVPMLRYWFQLA